MVGFLLPDAGSLAKLFRFLALVALFFGAAVTGGLVLFVVEPFGGSIGLGVALFVIVGWVCLIFFLYGFLLLIAHISDYIDGKAHSRQMEVHDDERG